MDEQQMINDILDSIYGYNILLKEGDKDTIALKKKEREEKHSEILTQINSICSSIEKELKNMLGTDEIGIKKYIRFNVLKSIKAEIENGNKVIDSNGKINTGKFLDIVNQSKDEIVELINERKESETIVYPDDENKEEKQTNEMFENLFEDLSDAGLDLNEDERRELQEIINDVNNILNEIQQCVDSGMTLEEAWNKKREEVGEEEFKKIKEKFKVVGKTIFLTNRDNSKGEEQENNGGSKDMGESLRTPTDDEPSKTTSSNAKGNGVNYANKKSGVKTYGVVTNFYMFSESCFYIEGMDDQTIVYNNPAGGVDIKAPLVYYEEYQKGVGIKIDKQVNDKELLEFLRTQRDPRDYVELGRFEQSGIFKQGNGNTGQEKFQRYMDTTKLFDSFFQTNMGTPSVPESSITDLLMRNGVEMTVDVSALTQLDTSTLTPATHEQIHSAMSLEDVTVDGAAVTQGESLEEAVTSRTINGDILTALVEGQGVVREIVDANGKVQDLTSPEKPLETPTEEKKDTQSTPVADNGDKGEDGPGEL